MRATYGAVAYAVVGFERHPGAAPRRCTAKENRVVPNGPLTDDGLVQLLTPAGRRTAHPDYDPAEVTRVLYEATTKNAVR